MINKKFSDLFLRKEKNREQKRTPQFDQTHFHCKLISKGINSQLITIQTQLIEGGQPLDEIKCKWYIKNSKDFKEIQDVNSSYYQPCLDDVGSMYICFICVQIQPFLEGKKYNGITIMEETEIIELDSQLDHQLQNFVQTKFIKLDARIEAIYSQSQKFQKWELPLQVKAQINQYSVTFIVGEQIVQKVPISQQFPNIEFIRKTFSSILFNFNQKQSMKISLNNNINRDLFALIIRTCVANTCSYPISINPQTIVQSIQNDISKPQKVDDVNKESEELKIKQPENKDESSNKESSQSEGISSENKIGVHSVTVLSSTQSLGESSKVEEGQKKSQQEKKSSTMFILKLDQLNKELKGLKRKYENLEKDYNIEKQGKCHAQNQFQSLKKVTQGIRKQRDEAITVARKVRQLKEDNRFYKNEIMIIKKELKDSREKGRILEKKLQTKKEEMNQQLQTKIFALMRECQQMKFLKELAEKKNEDVDTQREGYQEKLEKLENQNINLKRKIESLANEKGIKKPVNGSQPPSEGEKEAKSRICDLQMKLKNLQMLLKYKSSKGDSGSGLQMLVNKLTETITEKELQMNEIKKINKNLLEQLREAKGVK